LPLQIAQQKQALLWKKPDHFSGIESLQKNNGNFLQAGGKKKRKYDNFQNQQ